MRNTRGTTYIQIANRSVSPNAHTASGCENKIHIRTQNAAAVINDFPVIARRTNTAASNRGRRETVIAIFIAILHRPHTALDIQRQSAADRRVGRRRLVNNEFATQQRHRIVRLKVDARHVVHEYAVRALTRDRHGTSTGNAQAKTDRAVTCHTNSLSQCK